MRDFRGGGGSFVPLTSSVQVAGCFDPAYEEEARQNDGGIAQHIEQQPEHPELFEGVQHGDAAWVIGVSLGSLSQDVGGACHKEQREAEERHESVTHTEAAG